MAHYRWVVFGATLGLTLSTGLHGAAFAASNPLRGQSLYQNQCAACHSIDYNGVGPAHKNLFGRTAGSLADYTYSPALASSGIVWNEVTLDRWLRNPEKLVPGQKMGFMVPSAQDRADLIVYLKKATALPLAPP